MCKCVCIFIYLKKKFTYYPQLVNNFAVGYTTISKNMKEVEQSEFFDFEQIYQ